MIDRDDTCIVRVMPKHRCTSAAAESTSIVRLLRFAVLAAIVALLVPVNAGANTLFFTHTATPTTGGVGAVSYDGSGLNDAIITTDPLYPNGIAATTTHIFYLTAGSSGTPQVINRANHDGSGVATVSTPCSATAGGARPRVQLGSLATDGQFLYYGCSDNAATDGSIGRVGLDGTGANDDFILLGSDRASDLAVTATHIYFSTSAKVGRVALATGSTPTTIVVGNPQGISVNSTHVFWGLGNTIVRADADLSNTTTVVSGLVQNVAGSVVATDAYLFWPSADPSNNQRYRIGRSALDGSGLVADFVPASARGYIPGLAVGTLSGGATASHAVTIEKKGTGAGAVTSSPAGIDCGATCSASFASGAAVTLTATAAAGSTFTGWSGSCSGTAATCTVTVDAAKSVTATFRAKAITIVGRSVVSARGTTRISVRVPAAGSVRVVGTRSDRSRAGIAVVCSTAKRATKAGTVNLYCIPNRATRALLATRSVRVTLTVTYRSSAGTRVTDSVRATLPKRVVAPPEPVTG